MGYNTDFIGHIGIAPSLNEYEQAYLLALADSRRYDRPGGPYEIPGNPSAEYDERVADVTRNNRIAPGAPSLWCQWIPCGNGSALTWDGREKFYDSTQWMSYLIDHFLAPGAHASRSKLPWFINFTFDHVLNGVIAVSRRGTREMYLLYVEDNIVHEEGLVDPDPEIAAMGLLPYESIIDRDRHRRRRRPRAAAATPSV